VAAFPAPGPLDVVRDGETGVLHEDLREAIRGALALDGQRCREYALSQTWAAAANQFTSNLVNASEQTDPLPAAIARFRPV
jgi:hypothetical protein